MVSAKDLFARSRKNSNKRAALLAREQRQRQEAQARDRIYQMTVDPRSFLGQRQANEIQKNLVGADQLWNKSDPAFIAHDASGENVSWLGIFGSNTIDSLLLLETENQMLVIDSAIVQTEFNFVEPLSEVIPFEMIPIIVWTEYGATFSIPLTNPKSDITTLVEESVSGGNFSVTFPSQSGSIRKFAVLGDSPSTGDGIFQIQNYSDQWDFKPLLEEYLVKRQKAMAAGETGGPQFRLGVVRQKMGVTGGDPAIALWGGCSVIHVYYHLKNRPRGAL